MDSIKHRSSKSWQMRNKLMAVTLLLTEMDLYDRQSCDLCPYCNAKKKAQIYQNHLAPTSSTSTSSSSTSAAVVTTSDKLMHEKIANALNGRATNEQSLREKLQIYSVAQAQLNKAIEKGRFMAANNHAPVHKKVEKENIWLLQDQLSQTNSSPSSASSEADSGHLTGSDSSDFVTAASSRSAPGFVMKVSSV